MVAVGQKMCPIVFQSSWYSFAFSALSSASCAAFPVFSSVASLTFTSAKLLCWLSLFFPRSKTGESVTDRCMLHCSFYLLAVQGVLYCFSHNSAVGSWRGLSHRRRCFTGPHGCQSETENSTNKAGQQHSAITQHLGRGGNPFLLDRPLSLALSCALGLVPQPYSTFY